MGKLAKAFGLEKKGKIGLSLDKEVYLGGELVIGTVYISIYEPINCDKVVLKASGKESVSWKEKHKRERDRKSETYYTYHSGTNEFFKETIVLCCVPTTYQPGNYMYPFEYQLPANLPGSIEMKSLSGVSVYSGQAKIQYTFKATIDVNGFFARDLKAEACLAVRSEQAMRVEASRDSTTQGIKVCGCFNKGSCSLNVYMDKNMYLPNEVAQIQCDIKNNSSVKINRMACSLRQLIILKSNSGLTRTIDRCITERFFPGVNPQSQLQQPQPLELTSTLYQVFPSTNGSLVQCKYYIDIQCDIPWCPDVHLNLPITLVEPAAVYTAWVPPSTENFVEAEVVRAVATVPSV